jgi:hypothetical protein
VRIRGQFMQTNTATGRLAMEEPSLQTIPRPVEYELDATQDALPADAPGASTVALPAVGNSGGGSGSGSRSGGGGGGSGGVQQESNIRAAFVAPPGWVLLGADYKQLELRLMAHFSGDEALLWALGSRDQDPFVNLGQGVCGVRQAAASGGQLRDWFGCTVWGASNPLLPSLTCPTVDSTQVRMCCPLARLQCNRRWACHVHKVSCCVVCVLHAGGWCCT